MRSHRTNQNGRCADCGQISADFPNCPGATQQWDRPIGAKMTMLCYVPNEALLMILVSDAYHRGFMIAREDRLPAPAMETLAQNYAWAQYTEFAEKKTRAEFLRFLSRSIAACSTRKR